MADDGKQFETARTRALLATDLNEFELNAVSKIEEHGCFVLSVKGSAASLGWTYTFGIYNTKGRPELVTVGLSPSTASSAFNKAMKLFGEGLDLTQGWFRDLVGNVEVEFRPADPKWVQKLMNSAKWFNGGWDFPVLQMIYPDMENRFQWEEGFTEHFRQPLLQKDAPMTTVEEDFKLSADPESSFYDWKFPDPPHTSSYLSKTVHEGEEPVTYVSHDADGDWQFLGDSMSDGGGPVVVCLHHPIDKDASLKELADLPLGWIAERGAVGEPWVRSEHPPQEDQ